MKIIRIANEEEHNKWTPKDHVKLCVSKIHDVSKGGMSIDEMIEDMKDAIVNPNSNIRSYYPNWNEDDFISCVKMLEPYRGNFMGM